MIGANDRARRRGRANRPERDTEGWLARRLVVREPAAGRDQARTTLVDVLFGATADAGSIPAASITRIVERLGGERSDLPRISRRSPETRLVEVPAAAGL